MNFQDKISIPLSPEDKKYIKEKANQNRQTMSGFVRSKIFTHDFINENQVSH